MARDAATGGLEALVLRLLSEREMYGYEIVTELDNRSQSVFQMQEGALYPLLHRLEKERAVKAYEEKKEGRTRRYYRLTGRGRGRLAGEAETRQRCGEAVTAALCSTL